MKKLLSLTGQQSTSGTRRGGGALYPLFEELDGHFIHHVERNKEIEDLISLLEMRVEAEAEYSARLFSIADRSQEDSIKIGLLGKEVDSFKANCRSKAKAAAELAENVEQDCVQPLQNLLEEQDAQFKNLMDESRLDIMAVEDSNARVKALAHGYFEASEHAEKFIYNYQELKMNTDIALHKRRSMHAAMLDSIRTAELRAGHYRDSIPDANEALKTFTTKVNEAQAELRKFEEARCDLIHSAINQFVVFEKFAEMNNKYDVKNFSEMIDKFELQEELKTVCDEISRRVAEQRVNVPLTLFDPVVDQENRQSAAYLFAQYQPQRYEMPGLMNSVKFYSSYADQPTSHLNELTGKNGEVTGEVDPKHHKLLAGPPRTLLSHTDKEETLNYVLDKAFAEWQLTDEHIETVRELFRHPRWRDCFLELLEADYKSHGLDYKEADEIVKRNLRVLLPDMIYQNVLETFQEFLEALRQDMITADVEQKKAGVERLLRLMLYSKLFVGRVDRSFAGGTPSGQGGVAAPTLKRMLSDLRTAAIWEIEDIWIQIAKARVQHIVDGHYKDKPPTATVDASTAPKDSKEAEQKVAETEKFVPRSPYLLMLEEICSDMRRCQASTQRITQFVKFISSPQCDLVPAQVKSSDSAESREFQRGCEELIEHAGLATPRSSLALLKSSSDVAGASTAGKKDEEATSSTSQDQAATSTAENERDIADEEDPAAEDPVQFAGPERQPARTSITSQTLTGLEGGGPRKMLGSKKGSSQWVEGLETLFGGGHISLGAVKKRASGLAGVVSGASNVVASFVGNGTKPEDGEERIEEAEEDPESSPAGKGKQLEGAGSVDLAGTPKDVFEFEANQTPEADPEDKPQATEAVANGAGPGQIQLKQSARIDKLPSPSEFSVKDVAEEAGLKPLATTGQQLKSITIKTSSVPKFTSQTSTGKLGAPRTSNITARVTRPPSSTSTGSSEAAAARRAKGLRAGLPKGGAASPTLSAAKSTKPASHRSLKDK